MTASKRAAAKLAAKPLPDSKLSLKTYVDLSKLRKASLKRYKKHFKLDVKAESKSELLEAVGRHFAQMPVREVDVARDFHSFWRLRAGRRVAPPSSHRPAASAAAAVVVVDSNPCSARRPRVSASAAAANATAAATTVTTTTAAAVTAAASASAAR